MATKKKLLQAAAGQAGGAGLNVEEVFSTYLYTGTGSTLNIVNDIDLDGEGGLVWLKRRDGSGGSGVYDTERGVRKYLETYSTSAESTSGVGAGLTTFNSDGFTLGTNWNTENFNGYTYASWTFRKAPKFFDCVTWTGDGVQGRSISHNLGSVPAVIITKKLNATDNWVVYHRSNGAGKMLYLNGTNSTLNSTAVYPTTPTDSVFYVGNDSAVNGTSSDTYVAYLFAHNDGDGEFGPDADQDIIKCGSYTGNSSNDGPEIDLGFEPQFLIIKAAERTANWFVWDTMRGLTVADIANSPLYANLSNAEYTGTTYVAPTATGFKITDNANDVNSSLSGYNQYIYIAIRRGPMAEPESATDVFEVATRTNTSPAFVSGFVTDAALYARPTITNTVNCTLSARLYQKTTTATSNVSAESTSGLAASLEYDFQNGYHNSTTANSDIISFMWKRAPSYFDVIAYEGDGVTGSSGAVSHNLGVVPEMMWGRNRGGGTWNIYHKDILSSDANGIVLFDTNPSSSNNGQFYYGDQTNLVQPTSTQVTLGSAMKSSGNDFFIWLFASLSGVSKVGSYTGNGTNQTINCGFSAGARFVVIKRIDSTGDWYLWNTERGIVAGNDPHMSLNTTAAEVTTDDSIDPDNSGFIVNQVSATNINVSSATYIFYAIA